jgi:hypothetical protein
MQCIAVTVNEQLLCVAGISSALMIGPSIRAAVSAEMPPALDVRGMCQLGFDTDRPAHVYWCDNLRLKPRDCVCFAFVESPEPTPPIQIVPTDSPGYIEEQRLFKEHEKSFVPDPTAMRRTWPGLTFKCLVNDKPVANARFSEGEECILCSLLWDKWRPERCHVYVRSFDDKAKPERSEATEWLRANLALGDVAK